MPGDGLYYVNWKNPMLLGDQHLRLADRCATEARRWLARAVSPAAGGYGLIPSGPGGGAGVRWTHEQGADRLSVTLHQLKGLAPDGSALAFDEEADPQLANGLSASCELERNPPRPIRLGVLVEPLDPQGAAADAFVELGEPDTQEEPPRSPLRMTGLRLRVGSDLFSAGPALKVGEILWDGVVAEPSEDYLPPALSLAAWPAMAHAAVELRRAVQRLRETLVAAAGGNGEDESLLAPVVLPWLAALAALEDGISLMSADAHPHAVWQSCVQVLRVGHVMLSARPAALNHALQTFVQPGKLRDGNPHYFDDLGGYLGEPYDHDHLGLSLRRAQGLLDGLQQILEYLLGAAPAPKEAPVDTDVYFYRDKKYQLAGYAARTFEIDEAWHTCFLRELSIEGPKSLLLVCDKDLIEKNPRPNAGLWMLDKYEKVKANMLLVNVDNEADPNKVVALFQDIGEPTVTDVSLASRGLLNLGGLGPDPDEKIRIYYEL